MYIVMIPGLYVLLLETYKYKKGSANDSLLFPHIIIIICLTFIHFISF